MESVNDATAQTAEAPEVQEAPDAATETLFEEAHESLRPHYGEVGFQRLMVNPKHLTVGGGTCEFIAVPAEGFKGDPIEINFQDGLPAEVGVNGLSNETVLRAVLNRLRAFQDGPFACEENRIAIQHVNSALHALCLRTHQRKARQVEGELKA